MSHVEIRHSVCRACHVECGIIVHMEDGRPTKIHGDKDNPAYLGYSCIKGRQLGNYHSLPTRLLHSQKRQPDGSHAGIGSAAAMREIADKIRALISEHGPRSVALYIGTHGFNNIPAQAFAYALMQAIGSPMAFTSVTIDQPGKGIAGALHGTWLAGVPTIAEFDRLILVGTNPLVSMNGGLGPNPAHQLHVARQRGMKLIVIDPRLTECARHADIHLQVRPGEDAAVLACIAHVILSEGLEDRAFLDSEADGLEALREAVAAFTPAVVAERAGVASDALTAAARLFASGRCGAVSAGTGANMAGHGNVVEYLVRALTTLGGFWLRAGARRGNPGVLVNRLPAIAASPGPQPAFGFGEHLRVRNLTNTAAGLPTAALADEILTPGEGQVKALLVLGGNPMLAWPDQADTLAAMQALELLVTFDPHMSATSQLAHYVIAPKLPFEVESNSMLNELLSGFGPGWGYHQPYAQYAAPLMPPPAGSDLVEEWEALHGIAAHLGVTLRIADCSEPDPAAAVANGTDVTPGSHLTASGVWNMVIKSAPVPIDEVRATAARGRLFDRPEVVVQPKPADWQGKLDIGNAVMMAELRAIAEETPGDANVDRPYRLISRRMHDVLNSCWHEEPAIARRAPYNAAFMNPRDMRRDALAPGALIEIVSERASIRAIAQPEEGVRCGCISMTHAWGGNPNAPDDPQRLGSNTGRLTATDRDYDPHTGIPRMSNIPVAIRACA